MPPLGNLAGIFGRTSTRRVRSHCVHHAQPPPPTTLIHSGGVQHFRDTPLGAACGIQLGPDCPAGHLCRTGQGASCRRQCTKRTHNGGREQERRDPTRAVTGGGGAGGGGGCAGSGGSGRGSVRVRALPAQLHVAACGGYSSVAQRCLPPPQGCAAWQRSCSCSFKPGLARCVNWRRRRRRRRES